MATTQDDVVIRLRLKDVATFIAEVRAGRLSIDELEKKINQASRSAGESAKPGGGFGLLTGLMKHLAFAIPMALGGAAAATTAYAIKSAADLQQVKVGFETMLGSASAATKMVKDLQHFANITPFRLSDVESATETLLGFGWTAKNIIPTLKAVGDAASGLNIGSEGMNSVILALGQMQSKGRVQGDEIMQLSEHHINAAKYLMAGLGMNQGQFLKAERGGKISSDKAIPIILKGLEKDFRDLMDKQSKTLGGVWSNFQDKAQQELINIVNPYLPAMTKWLNQLVAALPGYAATLSHVVSQIVSAAKIGARFALALFDWGTDVYNKAKTAIQGFIQVVATALTDGDWTPVGGAVGTGMRNALQGAISLVGGAGGAGDWTDMGKSFVPHALEFILGVVSALLDPIMWFKFLKDHIWDVALIVVTVLTDGFGGSLGKLGEALLHLPFLKWAGKLLIWLQKGISWVRPKLGKFIGKIWDWIWGGFERVFPNVAFYLHYLVLVIEGFFTRTLPGLGKKAAGWAGGWIVKILEGIAEAPWRALAALGRFTKWLGKAIVGVVTSVAGFIGTAIMGALGSVFVWLQDKWDSVKGWFGWLFGGDSGATTPATAPPATPPPATVGTPPGAQFRNPGFLPGQAYGGTTVAPGLSWVGERGPELRYMPRGASVIPLPRAGSFGGGFGDREIHTHVSIDGREILHAVHRAQDDKVARR